MLAITDDIFTTITIINYCISFSDAEVFKNVVEGFLRCDLISCNFSENGDGVFKVFGDEVATEVHCHCFLYTEEGGVGTGKGVIVASVGDDGRVFGKFG